MDDQCTSNLGAPNSTAFHGNTYLVPGNVAVGIAEQTVNLLSAGLNAAQLDSQNLIAVFGGRVRSVAESPIDSATITIEFKDGNGSILSQQTRNAANVADRWDLVGDRLPIVVGTRQITYRFESLRNSGTSNDAYLDNAFLFVLPESVAPDFGNQGHIASEPIARSRICRSFIQTYMSIGNVKSPRPFDGSPTITLPTRQSVSIYCKMVLMAPNS